MTTQDSYRNSADAIQIQTSLAEKSCDARDYSTNSSA